MITDYNFHQIQGIGDHKEKLSKLPVGSFTLTFEKTANYILARLSKDLGLEIRVPRFERRKKSSFQISTSSSFRFCEKGEYGLFSQDYHQDDPIDKRWLEMFNRVIRRERGGRKSLESRFMILKESHTPN